MKPKSRMAYSTLQRHTPLRRVSLRRLQEMPIYWRRRERFLREHPYCQVWLAEHGVTEGDAVRGHGWVRLAAGGPARHVPRSRNVHHRNKRHGAHLLDETHWIAVSHAAHRRIEDHKDWAGAAGYLLAI